MTLATRQAAPVRTGVRLRWVAVAVGIAGQVCYPLTWGWARDLLSVGTVAALFLGVAAATVAGYGARRGGTAVLTAVLLGLAAEVIGVRAGLPFGRYVYESALGPAIAGVPLVVPLAWTTMGLCALAVGRRLAGSRAQVALVGGGALAAWDLFLDPQMVADGRWRWLDPHPALPGIPGVPASNFLGWLVVSVALVAVLDRLLPAPHRVDAVAAAVYCWTYASELLANVAFFHRPGVALVAGLGMGVFAVPYARGLVRP